MSYFSMNLSIYIEKHPKKYFPLLYDKKRLPDLTSDSLFFISSINTTRYQPQSQDYSASPSRGCDKSYDSRELNK